MNFPFPTPPGGVCFFTPVRVQRKFAVTLKLSGKYIDRRIGKVKGRPVMQMITFGASPTCTSCSVTFSPRKAETDIRP